MAGEMTKSSELSNIRTYLKRLDVERVTFESEMEGIVGELTSGNNPIGINTPLIDKEGYPRGDIDIYHARSLRKRLNEVQFNLKELMKKIEAGLNKMSAADAVGSGSNKSSKGGITNSDDDKERQARLAPKPKPKFDPVSGRWVVMNWDGSIAGGGGGDVPDKERQFRDIPSNNERDIHRIRNMPPPPQTSSPNNNAAASLVAFGVIDSVSSSSPAHEAGLQEGDLVVQFGEATSTNHKNLSLLAEVVAQAANDKKAIHVTVLRLRVDAGDRDVIVLDVLPRIWDGRGRLGCHIVLYNV